MEATTARLFVPVPQNPLHREFSSGAGDLIKASSFLAPSAVPPTLSSVIDNQTKGLDGLQRRSSLKNPLTGPNSRKFAKPSLLGIRWTSPISTIRTIPPRDALFDHFYSKASETSSDSSFPNPIAAEHPPITTIQSLRCTTVGINPPDRLICWPLQTDTFIQNLQNKITSKTYDFEETTLSISIASNEEEKNPDFNLTYIEIAEPSFSTKPQATKHVSSSIFKASSYTAKAGGSWLGATLRMNCRHLAASVLPGQQIPSASFILPIIAMNSVQRARNTTSSPLFPNFSTLSDTQSTNTTVSFPFRHPLQSQPPPVLANRSTSPPRLETPIQILPPTASISQQPSSPTMPKVFGSRQQNHLHMKALLASPKSDKALGKRRQPTAPEPNTRPSKFMRLGENDSPRERVRKPKETSTNPSRATQTKVNLNTPSHLPERLPHEAEDNALRSDGEPPVTSESEPSDDDYDGSLFGDGHSEEASGLHGKADSDSEAFSSSESDHDSSAHDNREQLEKLSRRRRRQIPRQNRPVVVNQLKITFWTNELKRFEYIRERRKLDSTVAAQLHQRLCEIDNGKEHTFITPDILGSSGLARLVTRFRHSPYDKVAKEVADRITKCWRKLCREE
ncbi:hypothetical protein BDZ97DRAFT_1911819 [Flammula alnicola]|nr:hypothetical protein BDZ97DRAFT_1911819 [Flammula alnicola]